VEDLPHDEQGQLLRPGVVWFTENLDDAVIDRIDDELDQTDLLLIIGGDDAVQCWDTWCFTHVNMWQSLLLPTAAPADCNA
jgi:NAD-dependent SIR2 family protein deacetylase